MNVRLNPALARLRASPTLAINERIRSRQAAGEDIVHFGFGQSPFPVPPPMAQAMADAAAEKDYMPAAGLPELCRAAAEYFAPRLERAVSAQDVLVGPGSKTLLFHALFCHAGPLVLPPGSWVSYAPQAALMDKPCLALPARPENQYKMTAADLDACLGALGPGHQAMVLLNSPNNPTGAVYDDDELEALAAVVRRHDALVLADEIYAQVTFADHYPTIARFAPERTLVTTGLSKAFSAGGYRLGLLVLPEECRGLRGPLVNMATETYSSVTCAVQRAGVVAYSGAPEVERHVDDCTAVHRLVLTEVARRLTADGVPAGSAGGAFYLFPDFGDLAKAAGVPHSEALADELLDRCKVATLPGTAFLAPPEHLRVRISPVDYDGTEALAVYRELAEAGEVTADDLIEKGAPRVGEGVRRLLSL